MLQQGRVGEGALSEQILGQSEVLEGGQGRGGAGDGTQAVAVQIAEGEGNHCR